VPLLIACLDFECMAWVVVSLLVLLLLLLVPDWRLWCCLILSPRVLERAGD